MKIAELVLLDDESQRAITIAVLERSDTGRRVTDVRTGEEMPLPNVALYSTDDPATAEAWRQTVERGEWPTDLPQPVIIRQNAGAHFNAADPAAGV